VAGRAGMFFYVFGLPKTRVHCGALFYYAFLVFIRINIRKRMVSRRKQKNHAASHSSCKPTTTYFTGALLFQARSAQFAIIPGSREPA
jgi:hypothetical protein